MKKERKGKGDFVSFEIYLKGKRSFRLPVGSASLISLSEVRLIGGRESGAALFTSIFPLLTADCTVSDSEEMLELKYSD